MALLPKQNLVLQLTITVACFGSKSSSPPFLMHANQDNQLAIALAWLRQ